MANELNFDTEPYNWQTGQQEIEDWETGELAEGIMDPDLLSSMTALNRRQTNGDFSQKFNKMILSGYPEGLLRIFIQQLRQGDDIFSNRQTYDPRYNMFEENYSSPYTHNIHNRWRPHHAIDPKWLRTEQGVGNLFQTTIAGNLALNQTPAQVQAQVEAYKDPNRGNVQAPTMSQQAMVEEAARTGGTVNPHEATKTFSRTTQPVYGPHGKAGGGMIGLDYLMRRL